MQKRILLEAMLALVKRGVGMKRKVASCNPLYSRLTKCSKRRDRGIKMKKETKQHCEWLKLLDVAEGNVIVSVTEKRNSMHLNCLLAILLAVGISGE